MTNKPTRAEGCDEVSDTMPHTSSSTDIDTAASAPVATPAPSPAANDGPDADAAAPTLDADASTLDATTPDTDASTLDAAVPTPAQKQHRASKADTVKFIGLIAFFVVMAVIIIAIWPYISVVFEEGGIQKLIEESDDAGFVGVLLIEAVQFLQIVIAFIPGEVVQITAGMLYGPWWGALIILIGCIVSSAFVFLLVHKLGAPFVHDMVPAKYLDKFKEFEHSKRFYAVVFILFLIPGLPKDIFTYITPLSDMRFRTFLLITNTARIPGIVLSTYAADGLVEGNVWQSVALFIALALIAGIALIIFNRIVNRKKS